MDEVLELKEKLEDAEDERRSIFAFYAEDNQKRTASEERVENS